MECINDSIKTIIIIGVKTTKPNKNKATVKFRYSANQVFGYLYYDTDVLRMELLKILDEA